MESGFLAAVDILVNHYLPESEFARKSAPNQLGLFGEEELAAAVAPKSRARNLRKPAKGQMSFNWDEESHPREATAHDGKRPGEFAPKEHAEAAKVAEMYPSLKDDVKPEPEEEEQPEPVVTRDNHTSHVWDKMNQAWDGGKTLAVTTRTRSTPISPDNRGMMRFHNGQIQLQRKDSWDTVTGETLDHLAKQAGTMAAIEVPLTPEEEAAADARSQKLIDDEAATEAKWQGFVDKHFGGDYGKAIDEMDATGIHDADEFIAHKEKAAADQGHGGIKRGRFTDPTPTHDELHQALDQVRQAGGKWWAGTNPVGFPTKWQAVEQSLHNVRAVNAREAGVSGDYPMWNGNFRDIASETELRKIFPPEEHERVLSDPAKMSDVIAAVNKKHEPEGGWTDADRVPVAEQSPNRRSEFEKNVGHEVIHPTKVVAALKAEGIDSYRKSRPRAADAGQGGVTVTKIPGKHTHAIVNVKPADGVRDFDYASEADRVKAALEKRGYTVSSSPTGAPDFLFIRKPLSDKKESPSDEKPAEKRDPITKQFPSLKGYTDEPKPAEPEPPKADEQSGPLTLAKLDERKERINTGKATADEVRQWHKELSDPANIEAIKAEFNKQSVAELKSKGATGYYNRQKKSDLIESIMDHIGDDYDVSPGGLSYMMGSNMKQAKAEAIQKKLAGLTDQHIADHAARLSGVAAKRQEASEAVQEGIKNPQTLDDFRNAARHYGGYVNMPEHIQVAFDEFSANRRRETAAQSKAKVTGFSGGTEATGATSIVEGHHQKRGVPTYTVTVEKHLGDGWGDALSRAKQLGGSYVNGRIAKAYHATPGFQFFNRADAEKFQKSLGGEEVDRSDRLDEKNIARMDNASERLAALSEATKKRAEEKLHAPRQTNTHRRAEHAAGAQAQARSEAAKAETMQRISEGLASGSLKHLGGIRARTHVDTLDSLLHSAKLNAWRDSTSQDSYEEMRERDATPQDIAKAKYPYPRIWDHELAEHLDELSQIPGLKNIARDLKKSTEKSPYKKKIGKISISGGEAKTADQLSDIPLARGLVKDKAVRIHVSQDPTLLKGRHPVAYTADGGKTWGTTQDIAVSAAVHGEINGTSKLDLIDPPQHEQVEIKDPDTIANIQKAIKILKRKSNPRLKRVAESLDQHMEDYNRLQSMDITTPMELRAALREYAPLKKKQDKEDPVKAKERSLIGRKIDGFFPTPRPAIDKMLAAADIQPGMSVLEPSAGKGDILDAVKEQHPDAKTIGIETNSDLRDLIGMKGHELHDDTDFLQHNGQYDRIVMNPPFEGRQDAVHVQHAYKNLAPGGRLVAIMGAGVFGGSSKKDQEFRDWLDEHGGEVEDMPEGSFNGADAFRKTGVNTRMVVIDKPHDTKQFSRDLAFVLSRI